MGETAGPDPVDEGTAYGMAEPRWDPDLIEVEASTPTGEMLRRYWHPFALGSDATATPKAVRILGEDLILFRTGLGEVGLVHPRCCHRGTTLFYGDVTDDGIRCCYHGWLFDTEGRCLDMPVEVDRGQHKERYRQPWYPVHDYHGMLFAYMGPAERKPVFATYDVFETVPDGFEIVADDNNIGLEGDPTPCNWFHRVTEYVVPNVRIVASPFVETYGPSTSVAWTLPISRTETKIFTIMIRPIGAPRIRARYDGRIWPELTPEAPEDHPLPTNGISLAMTVMVNTFASGGRLAI